MRVTFYGVRGSCPCSSEGHRRYGGNTACVAVELGPGEPTLILDLGTGLRPLGLELADRVGASEADRRFVALLSHLHWDHLIGLPFFEPILQIGGHLDVYGPAQEEGTIQEVVDAVVKPPFFPVQVGELKGAVAFHDLAEGTLQIGGARVLARWVPHSGRTLGFRVEADGATLAYLSDHQQPEDDRVVDPGVLALCDGADLVIHDAQYTAGELRAKADWGHSTPAYAVHVAAAAGARTLVLFHHDPRHLDEQLDAMWAAAQAEPEAATLARVLSAQEGMVLEVQPGTVTPSSGHEARRQGPGVDGPGADGPGEQG
ncbi:MBL fold metallo-hydrolase [Aciditerrimonas ferrireducens]|uniref:MBL fold metallo-hydrolase n=1 Tax=Aciditerrimonas ferrireducens TaxID=667306 RepID=A0ABV6C572_9ACTN